MATTSTEQQQAQEQKPAQQTARDRYRGRYSEAHPDLNLDDDEAFYTQANQNLDELESFRQTNKELGEAMDRTPELAGMVLAARQGTNPFAWLAENIGPDMDIRQLADNPEFANQMGEALKIFVANQEKAAAKKKEIGKNVADSFQTLKDYQTEKGLSDEECVKMAKDFFGELDDDGKPIGKESFMYLASNGIVTKGMWEALFNARHYENDIAAASDKARASALNDKVQNQLSKGGTGLPQSMSTGGGRTSDKGKKGKSGLAAFQEKLGL